MQNGTLRVMADIRLRRKRVSGEARTLAQLKEHYLIEKALANRLRSATKADRARLYASLYDELFRRVPHHQQLTHKVSQASVHRAVKLQLALLQRFLSRETVFLEVGPGDCSLSYAVAAMVRHVYAIDVSTEIVTPASRPANCTLILSDGCSIDVPNGSVDVAYSNQLLEHLHPDDAIDQLKNIFAALRHGGRYICATPNRLSGPWDISMYFDKEATGFHLKEYTVTEAHHMFRSAGFSHLLAYVGAKGLYVRVPLFLVELGERILERLPERLSDLLAHSVPGRLLLGMRLVGVK